MSRDRSTRGWRLLAVAICAMSIGAVGPQPLTADAANATIGAGSSPNRFSPNTQTVNVGDTVTFVWTSSGASGHNAVAANGEFPTVTMTQAQPNASWKASTPGTYYFYCSIHTSAANATEAHVVANDAMVGKIVVVASGAPAPNPGPVLAVPAAQPAPAKTGSAGLQRGAGGSFALAALVALTLTALAAARRATRPGS